MYQKNVHQLRETLFDKIDLFGNPYTDNQKFLKYMVTFDFESICVEDENFKDTETTAWIRKRIPISLLVSSNLLQEPILFCHPNPCDLVSSFIDALENLATKSKAQ